jgi:glycosyltransferase involved in cell wall biosynthesis
MRLIRKLEPDVLHGHGAKAGAFIRLKGRSAKTIRVYTPHGGSLHYPLNTLKGAIYSRLERALMNRTDLFLFESAFARDTYQRTIGKPTGLVRCVFNGVTANEFDPVTLADDATDVVYVGEFRHIKGADILVDAVALLRSGGRPVTLTLAGESRPYVVIEAAAAGVPMVAANVGGIPEIFGEHTDALFAPNIVGAMADAIETALDDPEGALERARRLRERIFLHFSQKAMVEGIMAGYRAAFANR